MRKYVHIKIMKINLQNVKNECKGDTLPRV